MTREKRQTPPDGQPPPGLEPLHEIRLESGVYGLAWSPDGSRLAICCYDGTVVLCSGETGEVVRVLKGHSARVYCAAWSPDSRLLASGSKDKSVRVWEAETGRLHNQCDGKGEVYGLGWSPIDDVLAVASGDGLVRLWDVKTETHRWRRSVEPIAVYVYGVPWSPDGRAFATADGSGQVRMWNAETGECQILRGHTTVAVTVDSSPDGKTLASGSLDNTVRIYDGSSGRHLTTLQSHTAEVVAVRFSRDGRILASLSHDDTIRFWRVSDWSTVAVLAHTSGGIGGLDFHPGRPIVATRVDQATVRIWQYDEQLWAGTAADDSIHYTNAKVVLLGETSTGKTCLARALMGLPFVPQKSTHGMKVWTLNSETVPREDGGRITRETMLWDLAGQVDYQVVHQLFLDQTALGVVMFDPTHPEDPFAGVAHWHKALDRVAGDDCRRLLVAGRVNRGHPTATTADIEAFCRRQGYERFFETSAETGQGVEEVRRAIAGAIPWDRLPVTRSPELWHQIREYLLKRRDGDNVLCRRPDLRDAFRAGHADAQFSEAEFDTVTGHAQAQGLVWRLAFGDFVLLKPELLNDYAAAIVRAARRQADGLGCTAEQDVLDATIDFEDLDRLPDVETERSLLHAVVQLLLKRELALRQERQLVFPSKFNRRRPDIPEPQPREVAYRFAGQIEEIYATLVVRLFYCGSFTKKDLWKNAAEFTGPVDHVCGFTLDAAAEGEGVLSVFFDQDTSDATKVLFLRFIHEHLHQRSIEGSVVRDRIYRCGECEEEVDSRRAVEARLKKGLNQITCQFCDEAIDLVDVLETKFAAPGLLEQIRAMEAEVLQRRDKEVGVSVTRAKVSVGEFDVFLAHNSRDKPRVEKIGQALRERGLNPWLDTDQVPPGRWFQDVIQQAIRQVKSAAIIIGRHGLGRWQVVELRSFIAQCVEREIPVIPVLLPGVEKVPKELVFLNEFSWVKFGQEIDDRQVLDNLQWGITGEHPRRE